MILFSYILQHLLGIFLILNKKYNTRIMISYCILSLTIIIFIFGSDTYDILSYSKSINSPNQFEFLFAKNLEILKYLGLESRTIIYFVQLELLILLAISAFLISKKDFLIIFAILSISIFYFLTVFNNLRQGFSCLFLLFAFLFSKNKKFFLTLVMMFIAQLFHKSSIFFIIIIFSIFLICDVKNKKDFFRVNDFFKYFFILFPLCTLSLALYFKLYQYIDLPFLGYFLDTRTPHYSRTGIIIKTLMVILVYVISEIIIDIEIKIEKIKFEKFFNELRLYRFFIINFIIITYFFQLYDLQSRFLFFYWFLEILMCLKAIQNKKFAFFNITIILTYVFAINAINQVV